MALLKLNLGCGPRVLEGFRNLDKSLGWRFEDGLPNYPDKSVAGITISHALMYLPESEWPATFAEFWRVLNFGGVLRITEDDCESTWSKRYLEPWPDAVIRTGPHIVATHLIAAGFEACAVEADTTYFPDKSLIQAYRHEHPPYYFFMEGLKL